MSYDSLFTLMSCNHIFTFPSTARRGSLFAYLLSTLNHTHEPQVIAYEKENRTISHRARLCSLPYNTYPKFCRGLPELGKTVPSYRMALEFEIDRWKSFRKALLSDEEREAFDELMDICRSNGMANGAACNPIIFEPMAMSILLAQQKKMQELENKLSEGFWQKISTEKPSKSPNDQSRKDP